MSHVITGGDRPPAAVLFDVDGTILRPGCRLQRLHMDAMAAAIGDETGVPVAFHDIEDELHIGEHSLSGFTDAGTVDLALSIGGVPRDQLVPLRTRVIDRMCDYVVDGMAGVDAADDLLPGVAALATGLARDGVLLGVSTGNAPSVVSMKLRATGLTAFAPVIGGFGDAEPERARVAARAVAALRGVALRGGALLERSAILLIGDTPSDLLAARSAGVRCLSVATGGTPGHVLAALRPDLLAADLTTVDHADLAAALRSGRLTPPRHHDDERPTPVVSVSASVSVSGRTAHS